MSSQRWNYKCVSGRPALCVQFLLSSTVMLASFCVFMVCLCVGGGSFLPNDDVTKLEMASQLLCGDVASGSTSGLGQEAESSLNP